VSDEIRPVLWDKKAEENLEDIYEYLRTEKKSEEAALNVWNTLLRTAGELGTYPRKYSPEHYLEDEPEEYRSVSKWSYKIIYEVTEESVIIADIFHTSQSPQKIRKR